MDTRQIIFRGVVLMLLLILFVFFVCKLWSFIFRRRPSGYLKVGELDRPLVSDAVNTLNNQSCGLTTEYDLEGELHQPERLARLPPTEELIHNQSLQSASHQLTQDASLCEEGRPTKSPQHGDSAILNIISEPSEDIQAAQMLKHPLMKDYLPQAQPQYLKDKGNHSLKTGLANEKELSFKNIIDQRSCLSLEVISGPSRGLRYSVNSNSASRLPLTLGRALPSDILLKDSEVSGKHGLIDWNRNKLKWELVDLGSLNGTLLNSHPVSHPDSGSRHRGDPVQLSSGDVITFGTTSNVQVHVTPQNEFPIPSGVGVASDPMSFRRVKKPMEDVCYHQWPVPGFDQFGLFGICDGHAGAMAAESASRIMPQMITAILSDPQKRERVLLQCDASEVLRDAFIQTDTCMDHYYEGCTSTLLLVWAQDDGKFFTQCANVGDSACVLNIAGNQITMTEDHRVSSTSERLRIQETGQPLRDGEKRICGLNLARMLGDKFLKEKDPRFISEPYISQAVCIDQASGAFAVMASDGFWDVVSFKRACQLVLQLKEKFSDEMDTLAWKVANSLLVEARTQRTRDNTSIIFLDFDKLPRISSSTADS